MTGRGMRGSITICLLAVSAVATLGLAPAASAGSEKVVPIITRVSSMRVGVGHLITIRGDHFKSKLRANTVIFLSSSGRMAFAKPSRASRTKLVVRVPEAVSRLLTVKGNCQLPTRLKLGVLAGNFAKFTPRRLSPVVTGVGGGVSDTCTDDADGDNELL